jgi:hypothetical protein
MCWQRLQQGMTPVPMSPTSTATGGHPLYLAAHARHTYTCPVLSCPVLARQGSCGHVLILHAALMLCSRATQDPHLCAAPDVCCPQDPLSACAAGWFHGPLQADCLSYCPGPKVVQGAGEFLYNWFRGLLPTGHS